MLHVREFDVAHLVVVLIDPGLDVLLALNRIVLGVVAQSEEASVDLRNNIYCKVYERRQE